MMSIKSKKISLTHNSHEVTLYTCVNFKITRNVMILRENCGVIIVNINKCGSQTVFKIKLKVNVFILCCNFD